MTVYNEERKEFRLNRFFNIFNPKVYITLIILDAVLLISGIYQYLTKDFSLISYIESAALGNVVVIVIHSLLCPKKVLISKDTIEFDDYQYIEPHNGVIRTRGLGWLKISYCVSQIKDIALHQNFIEKLFNVGRISFSGKARFTAKRDLEKVREKDRFVIYGIRRFSEFKRNFSDN